MFNHFVFEKKSLDLQKNRNHVEHFPTGFGLVIKN
jgi:hypothetical protein